jgi:hypothetical protein
MQATVLYGAGDVRFEDRADPAIVEPTDVVIRLPVTCIAGRTSGPIEAFCRSHHRPQWATSTAGSSRRWDETSRRSSLASS